MDDLQEKALLAQLLEDESLRDRGQYVFTIDALLQGAIMPLAIWPESNQNVARVISGQLDYNSLPFDDMNEFHKGGLFSEQQVIILKNHTSGTLCEALDMRPCLEENCPLYKAKLAPPVCKEYKMAFRK